ncbi:MAG: PAS domain S-box protein [Woeseiaceae bacterium]|nr:PAS domain S-box protein [Woeseiaceae bacterium]
MPFTPLGTDEPAVLGVSEDITERKLTEDTLRESEELFRGIIENSTSAIFLKDLEGRFQLVNSKFEEWYGISAADVIGTTNYDILPQEFADIYAAMDKKVIATETTREHASDIPSQDGTLRSIITTEFPVRDGTGRIVGVGSIETDVTAQKQTEDRAWRHQRELAHVLRRSTMDEMASALAHEINQPLTAIVNYTRGCIRLIESGKFAMGDILDALKLTAEHANLAANVVRNVHRFVKEASPLWQSVDVNEICRSAITLEEREFRANGVTLEFSEASDLPLIHANRIEIEQVVLNLLRNAVDAVRQCDPGSRTIRLKTEPSGESAVSVTVSDTGPGIPDDKQETIFDPFYSTKPNGMGMGLSISQTIIGSHGGAIGMSQNRHGGTSFKVTLPTESERDMA